MCDADKERGGAAGKVKNRCVWGVKCEVFAVAVSAKYVTWCVQCVCDVDDEGKVEMRW